MISFKLPPLILQDITGEETTGGVAGQTMDTIRDAGEETRSVLDGVTGFFTGIYDYLTSTMFVANIIATITVVVLAIVLYRIAVKIVPRLLHLGGPDEDDTLDSATLARIKRRDTAVTLVRNVLRYVTFTIVVLFVFSIFVRQALPAVAGASILAAIIGFGAQSFLRDIIAGFSILFEGQYSVGDFIEVHPTGWGGMVEEFGLRTTKIRTLSGELVFVPNGSITGVTNYVSGQQRFTVEVQAKDEEAAERILTEIKEVPDLYLTPPRLIERDDPEPGAETPIRLRIRAGVLPSTAWLIEENLVERIKGAAGEDGLAADPLIYKIDRSNIRRLRDFLPPEN